MKWLILALALAVAPAQAQKTEKAIFAAGCFWCTEAAFEEVPGVISAVSGYTGGTVKNPSYEQVSSGRTGHAEAVEVTFDPAKVSYDKLLDVFWVNHDPTVLDRQFCDGGPQYRPEIFYYSEEQKRLAGLWPASFDRIWEALATRLGHGQDGWELTTGPITDKSVLPMRSFVQTPMRHGRLFLAGDAAHIVPPTGAKGLNLAVADVALLAPAVVDLVRKDNHRLADGYSDTALRRVWRCTHFSWWMTTMLHQGEDPFDEKLQLSQLHWVTSSEAGAAGLAENYAGLPIGF